jgi:hypothetical protein
MDSLSKDEGVEVSKGTPSIEKVVGIVKGTLSKYKAVEEVSSSPSKDKARKLTKGTSSNDKVGKAPKGSANKGTLSKDKEKAPEACKGVLTKDKGLGKTKHMKPPNPFDDDQQPSKKLKIITILGVMELDDDEGEDSKPLSKYVPKVLGRVQEKIKEWKECKLPTTFGRFLQTYVLVGKFHQVVR